MEKNKEVFKKTQGRVKSIELVPIIQEIQFLEAELKTSFIAGQEKIDAISRLAHLRKVYYGSLPHINLVNRKEKK